MADSQNHSQVVADLLSSIRTCVNALTLSDHQTTTSVVDISEESDATFQEVSQVESAILLMLEEHCFSVHNIRVDISRNEYKLTPVKVPLNDSPDGTGGGVRLETIPYCFARPANRKKWQAVFIRDDEEDVWTESHNILKDFWREINNPQIAIEDKKPLVQAILTTLYNQDCLDNPDVKEFIIAVPEEMGFGLFDTLKAKCAEVLPTRLIEHHPHVFSLLTENSRYANIPSKHSILYSLLRSVDGVPSEEQVFLFFDADNICTLGHLKGGAFEEHIVPRNKSGMDIDLQSVYAVGVVDEGEIQHPLIEHGYYNFHSIDEAKYMAKTLAIIQEGTLETFKLGELLDKLMALREKRDKMKATYNSNNDYITRLKRLLVIPMPEVFAMQTQLQER